MVDFFYYYYHALLTRLSSDLKNDCCQPDDDKDITAMKSCEDISFAVDLPSVEFIEERHQDECVEDHREMDILWRYPRMISRIKVEQKITCVPKNATQ